MMSVTKSRWFFVAYSGWQMTSLLKIYDLLAVVPDELLKMILTNFIIIVLQIAKCNDSDGEDISWRYFSCTKKEKASVPL